MAALKSVLGPRVPDPVLAANRPRFVLPTVLLFGATVLLLASFFQPYWHVTLFTPDDAGGLELRVYLNHLEGDVDRIDEVHREIGMPSLSEAATLERTLSLMTIVVLALLVVAAIGIHSPWAAVASLPALLFPLGFLIDMYLWLRSFGREVEPSAVDPEGVGSFTPTILGETVVGSYRSVAGVGPGLILALVASVVIVLGLYFHRRAYKPMVEARRAAEARWGEGGSPSGRVDSD